jgi:hypothetical protein
MPATGLRYNGCGSPRGLPVFIVGFPPDQYHARGSRRSTCVRKIFQAGEFARSDDHRRQVQKYGLALGQSGQDQWASFAAFFSVRRGCGLTEALPRPWESRFGRMYTDEAPCQDASASARPMAKPVTGDMVEPHLDDKFRLQRFPFPASLGAPSAGTARSFSSEAGRLA